MSRLVAFLRGINLGNRRVSADELKDPFLQLGLDGVATFIASGNVIFEDPDGAETPGKAREGLEARIEASILKTLGFESDTMIRSLGEVDALTRLPAVEAAEAEGRNVFVTFAKTALPESVRKAHDAMETPDDGFVVLEREVLWLRAGGVSDSAIKQKDLDGAMGGIPATRRKVTTLRRLVAKFGEV